MQTLDFNKVKKEYFIVTLNDEKKTKLQIMMPTKRMISEVMDEFAAFTGGDTPTAEDLMTMYDLTARLMSRNRTGVQITGEQLAEILDFDDIMTFIDAYTTFITEKETAKNS